jgi:tRNA threonylcarbamoyl adenosine modification protein YjeE
MRPSDAEPATPAAAVARPTAADRAAAPASREIVVDLADETATVRLAEDIAALLRPGDVVTLAGDLGAGKSALARAVLRAVADDPDLEVPSPTFTLVQTYATPRLALAHLDLYRLGDPDEIAELGLDDLADHVLLVEWPDRAGDRLADDRLEVTLTPGADDGARRAVLVGRGAWAARLPRTLAIRRFLAAAGWAGASRRFLYGDAHHRAYERVRLGDRTLVLMNQPAETDERKRTQRRLQHLSEDTRSFHGFAIAYAARGFTVPAIVRHDVDDGLMLVEDFGDTFCIVGEPPAPVPERYRVAVETLARLHGLDLPAVVADGVGGVWPVPAWDVETLANEVAVLLDWGVAHYVGRPPTEGERADFLGLWRPLFAELDAGPKTWCLRDFHSPNLMWLADRAGAACLGILDFQDTIFGSPAYDVASLAQDARVTVPEALERDLVAAYLAARAGDAGFDVAGFRRAYAILAVQRATRLLGQFPRLKHRDGKPGYLRHIPRLWDYLIRTIEDPVTRPLKLWYDAVIPQDRRR